MERKLRHRFWVKFLNLYRDIDYWRRHFGGHVASPVLNATKIAEEDGGTVIHLELDQTVSFPRASPKQWKF